MRCMDMLPIEHGVGQLKLRQEDLAKGGPMGDRNEAGTGLRTVKIGFKARRPIVRSGEIRGKIPKHGAIELFRQELEELLPLAFIHERLFPYLG